MRIFGMALIFFCGMLLAQENEGSESFVTVNGIGKPPEGASAPQKKLLAKRASQVVALENLKEALLTISGLSEDLFAGIDKLMTFYTVDGPNLLENGDAQTKISLSKRQVLLHYVGLFREFQEKTIENQTLQQKISEMNEVLAEQQRQKDLILQENARLKEELNFCKNQIKQLSPTEANPQTIEQILQELKNLKKEVTELRNEVFRLQVMQEDPVTEDEIDFK